ncbi:MAG: biopolymer transporter ExbD [Planctomycetaceae bacterium]
MPIRFRCPSCQQLSGIATRMAGKSVLCPRCQARIVVPTEDMADALWDLDFAEDDDASESIRKALEDRDADEVLPADEAPAGDRHEAPAHDDGAANFTRKWKELRSQKQEIDAGPSPAEASGNDRPPPTTAAKREDSGENEEFSIRKFKGDLEEMDLTPMVDCTFLLLIFFMITASFSLQKSIQVPDPNPDKKGAAQSLQTLDDFKEDSIIVEIDEKNAILIDDEPLAGLSSLPQVLSNKMRSEKKNELMLSAHDKAWHETVIKVIDAANEVGMQKIRMSAHQGSAD